MDVLQQLSLVQRVIVELENHLGLNDKTVAEFVIDLARKSPTAAAYTAALSSNGAEFPAALVNSIYSLVQRFTAPAAVAAPAATSAARRERSPERSSTRQYDDRDSSRRYDERDRDRDSTRRYEDRDRDRDRRPESDRDRSRHNPEAPAHATATVRAPVRSAPVKRMTSPERWEMQQLINAGVKVDRTAMQEERAFNTDAADEDVEIVLKGEEPTFLKGQTGISVDLSPIRVTANPDGSMARAAMNQGDLARERREMREQQRASLDGPAKTAEDRHVDDGSAVDWRSQRSGQKVSYGKRVTGSIREQREGLPIYKLRKALMTAINDNQLLVVIGDTGSGKTTQITQYLAEEGYAQRGKIGCTQPRRVAAMSVAKRVAEEVGCKLGAEVGYSIRFEDCTSPETRIKYMTDGMLLRECLLDDTLKSYSVIVLDEAHERTVHTDVLFGLCMKAAQLRPDLKLIVTSATLEAEKFSSYFNNCPIFTIPGRMFPVEILYTKAPEADYLDAALMTIMQIHLTEPPGDILVFLTGQEEIDSAVQIVTERVRSLGRDIPELIPLPVYSALPSEMQTRIFDPAPPGARKCVIATNIAETSLTIDGIYYVVDPGFSKQKVYNAKTGIDSLVVAPISQAQAKQRSGRAGRTGPGKCYRLYTEQAFKAEMLGTAVPEIQRTNLGNVVLMLKAMGINDLLNFNFMDPPPTQTMVAAMELLYALGALDDEGLLTRLGRKMAEFPLDPQLSKVLIASADPEYGCSEDMLTIVAMLSVENVFYRPKEKQQQADLKKAKFHQAEGDHLTLLSVYNSWKQNNYSTPWCFENYVQARGMRRAQDIRKQLTTIMDRYKLDIVSCGRNWGNIRKVVCSGYFKNAARRDPQEGYKSLVENTPVYIHPSSALFQKNPDWVVYHELVLTTKEYMRNIVTIDPRWLPEVAPHFFKVADAGKLSKRKRQERIQPLFNRFEEPNAWRISKARRA
eukprot:TRINITY_DN1885_c0_g2_i1.p1 TRINITY_DN1885_c0_g2~~TRINITY_DN1885_c0_g2_i1.p1  ORF type:complete len:967 (-),score=246.37 TRINITY_DN1885_c0_g2_i1:44-2944(-)